MKRGDEHDMVTLLYLIFVFPLQLPIRIVDEDKNAGSANSTC